MKRLFLTLLTFILILSSFSVLGVAFMDHSVHETCPFTVMSSRDCETVVNTKDSIFHHISAFQGMSEVLLSSSSGVLALLLLAAIYITIKHLDPSASIAGRVIERLGIQKKLGIPIFDATLRWISLQSKRNTHLYPWRMVT